MWHIFSIMGAQPQRLLLMAFWRLLYYTQALSSVNCPLHMYNSVTNILESIITSELWNILSDLIPKPFLELRLIALYHGQINMGWQACPLIYSWYLIGNVFLANCTRKISNNCWSYKLYVLFCFHMWRDVLWTSLLRWLISFFISLICNQQFLNIKYLSPYI